MTSPALFQDPPSFDAVSTLSILIAAGGLD
jgi:hypothetical protein